MIFIGDIAIPEGIAPLVKDLPSVFQREAVIANLEGPILRGDEINLSGRAVYNSYHILAFLKELNIKLVSLANNHMFDVGQSAVPTVRRLLKQRILSCGAGNNANEAAQPVVIESGDGRVVFLAFGWETIQCKAALKNKPGVNPLRPNHVLSSISLAREQYPMLPIVLLMHWNYELEIYPQPMHRQLAFAAIDEGATAVIGCHSHCVQGIENYKDSPIVYGLGNWYLPEGQVFGREIRFPDFAHLELAFEWSPYSTRMNCHWFRYMRDAGCLRYDSSEDLHGSKEIEQLTPFNGMNHGDYIQWFKENRRKSILLPVYTDYNDRMSNTIKDRWVAVRQLLLRAVQASGLRWSLR